MRSESPMADRLADPVTESAGGEVNSIAAKLGERVAQETTAMCVRHFGAALQAVILTGSLARGEGSLSNDGIPGKLASDAEFVAVLEDRTPLPTSSDSVRLSSEIESQLAAGGVRCHVSLSCVHDDFLRKMRPHIFAYELKTCGKVLHGERTILSLIHPFTVTDIPLEDAWRLLSNRMIEMAEALCEAQSAGTGPVPQNVFYRAAKLQLDTATSLLIFTGNYAPSYRERCRELNELAKAKQTPFALPLSLTELARGVDGCTGWKLSQKNAHGDIVDWEWVAIACRNAFLLWEWELRRMTNTVGELSPFELCMRLMRQQPLGARMRGWLYVMRQQGWKKTAEQWPRWMKLGMKGSPRYLIYALTGELFIHLDARVTGSADNGDNELSCDALRRYLPVLPHDRPNSVEGWQRTAQDAVWNYQQFLVDTRA
jgi:hypothetical protein